MYIARAAASAAVLSMGIIFPLYIYPGTDCSAWTDVNSALSTHPNLPFYIVVNPNSGPGDAGTQPDINYQTCVAQLKTSSSDNVKFIGYIRTGWGNDSSADVISAIDTYSGWNDAYRPVGIFFDEVATGTDEFSLYQSYVTRVRQDFTDAYVVLNPGTPPSSDYFTIADFIVTAEQFYDDFEVSDLVIGTSTPASQQAVILHDGPSTTPVSLVDDLAAVGVKAIFITDFADAIAYENIPTDWVNFVNDVQAA